MDRPLAVDLFCGLGGWAEGLLDEGWQVIGFDIERRPYPGELVLQDVNTLHGRQFANADLIVASPPCQAYSYRAMPWKRAKALPPPDNTLFEACFRIQREACEASGRYIPLVVENVVGAQKWVGRAGGHYGSYYLWGDVPKELPSRAVLKTGDKNSYRVNGKPSPHFTDPFEVGIKQHGSGRVCSDHGIANLPSKSARRKAASALIAKIPYPLARHIARVFKPEPSKQLQREESIAYARTG